MTGSASQAMDVVWGKRDRLYIEEGVWGRRAPGFPGHEAGGFIKWHFEWDIIDKRELWLGNNR